jgi:hypothetical protein
MLLLNTQLEPTPNTLYKRYNCRNRTFNTQIVFEGAQKDPLKQQRKKEQKKVKKKQRLKN